MRYVPAVAVYTSVTSARDCLATCFFRLSNDNPRVLVAVHNFSGLFTYVGHGCFGLKLVYILVNGKQKKRPCVQIRTKKTMD